MAIESHLIERENNVQTLVETGLTRHDACLRVNMLASPSAALDTARQAALDAEAAKLKAEAAMQEAGRLYEQYAGLTGAVKRYKEQLATLAHWKESAENYANGIRGGFETLIFGADMDRFFNGVRELAMLPVALAEIEVQTKRVKAEFDKATAKLAAFEKEHSKGK